MGGSGAGKEDFAALVQKAAIDRGLARSEVLVGIDPALPADGLTLSFISYTAVVPECGYWHEESAHNFLNANSVNFGCATQHNLGLMLADPSDLYGNTQMDPRDGQRTAIVIDLYRRGEITGADGAGAGPVKHGGKRRTLAAHCNVGRPEIPDNGQAQGLGQQGAVACLVRAAPARVMGECLAVKAQDIDPCERGQKLCMGGLNHLGRISDSGIVRPASQRRTQRGAFGLGIRAVAGLPECLDCFAVGDDDGRVHPVERGARHRPQRPHRHSAAPPHADRALSSPPPFPWGRPRANTAPPRAWPEHGRKQR
jgi:hypothetical protein